jgi:alkyl sulfatase BDS1-like metallo-beta-lactamase superfamily hydrolase
VFRDSGHAFALTLRNGVLPHREHDPSALPEADLTLRLTTAQLFGVLGAGRLDDVAVEGDAAALGTLAGVLDPGDPAFEIVLPRRG